MKLNVDWGHTSARRLTRVLADPDGETFGLANYVDEALEQSEICRTYDTAPHVPIAGTTTVSPVNERLQVELSFSGDAISLRATYDYCTYPLSAPLRSQNPQEVGGVFRSSRIAMLEGQIAF